MSELRRAVRADDLIAYQEKAIVSKTLVKLSGGNVTLFAFDAGEELSEHTSPYEALIYVVDGEARVTIAGEAHTVARGEMIALPAGRPHAVKAEQAFKMLLILIKGETGP